MRLCRLDGVTKGYESVLQPLVRRETEARLTRKAARVRNLEDARDAEGAVDLRGEEDAEPRAAAQGT